IEEVAVKHRIPLDSVIVKMSAEEAIEPLRKAITDAYPEVREAVERSLETVRKGEKVLIIGVGNTSGVGNDATGVKTAEEFAAATEREIQKKQKGKK
ncbi:MAG: DUF1512 family protein, partial [Candidatus Aenigmarchaeota archaeon]|nr:DUF1512 family protein [Candidatus Aenigmarchaeota archaeon]